MENESIKCTLKKHNSIDAVSFCQDCKLYMCNKCCNHHSELFEKDIHTIINIDKDKDYFFSGYCNEEKHKDELEYFCQTHNVLCCASCLSVIKSKGNGNHKDCKVCNIEEIKDEKKNKLNENIDYLDNLSKKLEENIKNLKEIYEKIIKDKEELKIHVQKIFTKIRSALNEKEDQILLTIDKEYDKTYFNDDLIQKSEKLPNKIKVSLEKGKLIQNKWEDKNLKLNSLINSCINIENNINDINKIKKEISKYLSINIEIKFDKKENDVNTLIENIKSFGNIQIKEDEINKFIRLIKEKLDEYKYEIIKPKLIYDASKDGQNYSNCHSKCNKVPNTISLITTNNDKIFGLYRSIPINGSDDWKIDNKAFFISLDKEKIYRMKKDNSSIAFDDSYFIQTIPFGLTGNILSNNYNCPGKDSMNQYFEGFTEDYELTCGQNAFTVKKFEVFQLNFENN